MPEQLVFDLPHLTSQDAEDFLVSASNRAAVDLVGSWPQWLNVGAIICGPAGVGKSHLVNVWRQRSAARLIRADELSDELAGELASAPSLAIEDIDRGLASERALFHLLNIARERQRAILLTTRLPPGELDVTLPDLRSRLRALPVAAIAPPDDTLLQGLLVKLFMDRQLRVEPATVGYLLNHMERSAEAAVRLVTEIDRASLSAQRRVTKHLARQVICKLFPVIH